MGTNGLIDTCPNNGSSKQFIVRHVTRKPNAKSIMPRVYISKERQ